MSTTTDGDGKVQMPSMPRKGFHTIHAISESFGTQELRLDGKDSAPAERTIELRPTGGIEGQLKADNPEWIRGVQLWFNTKDQLLQSGWVTEGSALVTTDD